MSEENKPDELENELDGLSEAGLPGEALTGESELVEQLESIGFDEPASADSLVGIAAMSEEIEPATENELPEKALSEEGLSEESELVEEQESTGVDEPASADSLVEIAAMSEEIEPAIEDELSEEALAEEILSEESELVEEQESTGVDEPFSADSLVEIAAMSEEIEPAIEEELSEEALAEEILSEESELVEEQESTGVDEPVSTDSLVEIAAMSEESEPAIEEELSEEALPQEVLTGEERELVEELESIEVDEPASANSLVEDEITATREEIKPAIESLLFVAEEPLPFKILCKLLGEVSEDDVRAALDELLADYDARKSGLEIREIGGGWRISTRPQNHDFIRKYLKSRPSARLSLPALETLAVIAYKQPITIPEILEIRGVTSSSAIKTLLEKRLIVTKGRKETVGRPMLYGTSKEFLIQFGLKDLTELPSIEDFEDLAQ
jgi:segregation and condensation protein B